MNQFILTFDYNPDGFIPITFDNPKKFMSLFLKQATKDAQEIIRLRYWASISGAMRWENSQEAAIIRRGNHYDYY